jgi:hypothetical protein
MVGGELEQSDAPDTRQTSVHRPETRQELAFCYPNHRTMIFCSRFLHPSALMSYPSSHKIQ